MKPLTIEQFAEREGYNYVKLTGILYKSYVSTEPVDPMDFTRSYLKYLLEEGGVLPSEDEINEQWYHTFERMGAKWAVKETRNRLEDILK